MSRCAVWGKSSVGRSTWGRRGRRWPRRSPRVASFARARASHSKSGPPQRNVLSALGWPRSLCRRSTPGDETCPAAWRPSPCDERCVTFLICWIWVTPPVWVAFLLHSFSSSSSIQHHSCKMILTSRTVTKTSEIHHLAFLLLPSQTNVESNCNLTLSVSIPSQRHCNRYRSWFWDWNRDWIQVPEPKLPPTSIKDSRGEFCHTWHF